ncbi:LacI family DNA-binding transcriptional regulator [Enterobacteriaceae bacterium H20N1]|uniref:LacI family DNA-binding transcriptional regulator n=1 Tax=Dryocola boscaweniae TaxID=2925397 RepID=A0A9X2W7Z4_9ENTR|nr:LacI family DNA-binding transcriptional regulator [Dryocola boscaweniae]MCT4701833.1 LacI family DNA-binding transcriptional regulator [Dryocola boscaweniae]MCT4714883.1 LacI family DNA-binding transcriptional regulator [Dryocola boscaweniae]MCT4719001.1 LacI family DNA-binding transcriptional regulator [Dryocola boscaweniae]
MSTVTLAQVAQRASVSTATVSMVLRNRGRISSATRERVLLALDELGYVYNQTAANLRNRTSNQVGLLLHDITNPFYGEMTAGLSQEMERHDLLLFLANSEESGVRQQKFVDSLMRNNACGMVLCAARETPPLFFETLKRRNIPAIMVVRPLDDVDFDFVGTDNFLGTQLATQHLLRLGHRHIAFIGGSENSISRAQRIGGYSSKLLENRIQPKSEWVISSAASQSDGARVAEALFERYPEITAAVCYQDIVALGVMQTLRKMGRMPGKDFALIGFDDVTEAALVQPALTTVSVAAKEIGRKAGELLFSRIQGNDEPPKRIILPPTLVVRESCGFK